MGAKNIGFYVFVLFFSFNNLLVSKEKEQDKKPLKQRIEGGYKSGRLTQSEYEEISADFNKLRNARKKANEDGNISEQEKKRLGALRRDVEESLREERRDIQFIPEKMLESFERRLANGFRNGDLTPAEFAQADEAFRAAEKNYKASVADGTFKGAKKEELRVSFGEVSRLIKDLSENDRSREISSTNAPLNSYDVISQQIKDQYKDK